jgi:H+/Cl- antiporter ClcA
MSSDPLIGIFAGLIGWVLVGLFGAWFAGLFSRPPRKDPPVAAE